MINWSHIDTVFLDMDGTLLDLHFDNHFWREHMPRRYAEYHGLAPETARAHLDAHYARHAGTLNWYCLDFWSSELALDIVQLKEEVVHLIAVRPDVPAFLQALRRSTSTPRCRWARRSPTTTHTCRTRCCSSRKSSTTSTNG